MRSEYIKRGYQEVISPNLFHIDLWKVSGHYKNYKENLYLVNSDTQSSSPMQEEAEGDEGADVQSH